MAVPHAKLKKDPPGVIAFRMRLRPPDDTVTIVKTSEGVLVRARNVKEGPCKWPDGSMRQYSPLTEEDYVPSEVAEKLKAGIADNYEFKFCSTQARTLAIRRGRQHWHPVSRKAMEAYCPYAEGEKVGDFIVNIDTILHKRPRGIAEQILADKQDYDDIGKNLAARNAETTENLRSLGGVDVDVGIERVDDEAMTFAGAQVVD